MNKKRNPTIAYVLKKFPVLSETFILNEILSLEALDVPVHIFSLERPNDPRFHEDVARLEASISYVPDLAKADSLWKHRSRVASRYREGYRHTLEYTLRRTNPSLFWRFLQSCYLASEAKRLNIGHFHAHFATRPTTVAFMAAMITGLPFSFTAHAMDIYKTRLSRKALRKKVEKARFVVTVSDYNRDFLAQETNGVASRIEKINNGIDFERFRPSETPRLSPFTFLCVARLVEKKGHDVLVEACRLLRERDVDFQCWVVGKGRLRTPISELVQKHKLQKRVHLLGARRQGEMAKLYRRATASVLPCRIAADGNRDGLPVSIVEALACGLPVITSPVTGIPEVVRDGYNGILVPSDNPPALAEAMEQLVADGALWERLRANARSSVEEEFDRKRSAEALRRLFMESAS